MTLQQEAEKSLDSPQNIEQAGTEDYDARINAFTEKEQKAIIWRVDCRLVLTLGFMYCVSLIDRTNLGIAVVGGMGADLQTTVGVRYSLITLVFFVCPSTTPNPLENEKLIS